MYVSAIEALFWGLVVPGLLYVAKLLVDNRIRKGVDHHFDARLEDHKHRLGLIADRAKLDFQRELADFTLYTTKRHQAAEAVYSALRIAHGHVSGLFGISLGLSFEEFNTEDIKSYMSQRRVPAGKQEEVLMNWAGDHNASLAILKPYLRMLEVQEAGMKFTEAKNAALLNELYFPDPVIEAISALLEMLGEWMSYAEYPRDTGESWRPDRKALNGALDRVHHEFRSVLDPSAKAVANAEDPEQ